MAKTTTTKQRSSDWQQHLACGFIAGPVRKRLKPNVTTVQADGQRVDRIVKAASAK